MAFSSLPKAMRLVAHLCRRQLAAVVASAPLVWTIPEAKAQGGITRGGSPHRVVIGPNTRVTPLADTTLHVEPHLAVDPTDGRRLVATAMAIPAAGRGPEVRVYTSADAARTWTRRPLGASPAMGGDPWVAFGPGGVAYLLKLPGEVWRSTDAGRTWAPPVIFPQGDGGPFDYPKLAVDHTGGEFAGRVYVWASQSALLPSRKRVGPAALLWSADSGRTLSAPVRVLPNNFGNQVGGIGVLSDGAVVATFHEIDVNNAFLTSPRLWAVRSTNGGATVDGPFLIAENFLADSPDLVVDPSAGPFRDRVYVASTGRLPTGRSVVFLRHSVDRGETWSAPALIRDTLPAGRPGAYLPHRPALAVNREGVVGITWQDPRYDLGARCFALSFTASLDGGATFLPPTAVAAAASCAETPANSVTLEDGTPVSRRYGDGGDYHGLVALPDGSFQALWADSRTGSYQLWTAHVRVEPPVGGRLR
ncbi:MAG: exo-alpha-sialidase [Phycisphaerae bacterium]|nr:exo-alpha-sialidase [Gemmatimonadaceae bacterium]